MSYGPAEEIEMMGMLTDDRGELDIEMLVIALLELRDRIARLEDDTNQTIRN